MARSRSLTLTLRVKLTDDDGTLTVAGEDYYALVEFQRRVRDLRAAGVDIFSEERDRAELDRTFAASLLGWSIESRIDDALRHREVELARRRGAAQTRAWIKAGMP